MWPIVNFHCQLLRSARPFILLGRWIISSFRRKFRAFCELVMLASKYVGLQSLLAYQKWKSCFLTLAQTLQISLILPSSSNWNCFSFACRRSVFWVSWWIFALCGCATVVRPRMMDSLLLCQIWKSRAFFFSRVLLFLLPTTVIYSARHRMHCRCGEPKKQIAVIS